MASPLAHDFNRTIRSKSILISMAVLVALSLALVPLANLSVSVVTFGSGSEPVLYYRTSTGYNLLAYSFNTYGQPVQGTSFNVTMGTSTGRSMGTATTNSSGLAQWSIQTGGAAYINYTLRVNGNMMGQGRNPLEYSTPIGEVGFLGQQSLSLVTDPSNSSQMDVVFFYEGPNGTLPTGYGVYYNFSSSYNGGQTFESDMTLLGHPTGYVSDFKLPPMSAKYNTISVAAFDSNGNVVTESINSYGGATYTPPSPTALFSALASSILALVVPLMAILVAYNAYGKDKTNGVLDSVLTRPVTRRGLGLSRYLSIVLSMVIALAVTIGVMALISQVLLGATFPLDFAAYAFGGLAVEAAAFVGIMMLAAHLIKSNGGLIGTGIVLWIVLDFAWGIFILVAALALHIQIGSGDYLGLTVRSGFFNPAQFYGLVGQYLNGVTSATGGSGVPISPAAYGLTPLTLGAAAVLWIAVPLLAFLQLAIHRD